MTRTVREVEMQPGEDCTDACRRLVAAGEKDGPLVLTRNGRRIFFATRLYRAAALVAREEPRLHFARWRPHFRAEVSPILAAVVAAEHAAMDDERRQAKR